MIMNNDITQQESSSQTNLSTLGKRTLGHFRCRNFIPNGSWHQEEPRLLACPPARYLRTLLNIPNTMEKTQFLVCLPEGKSWRHGETDNSSLPGSPAAVGRRDLGDVPAWEPDPRVYVNVKWAPFPSTIVSSDHIFFSLDPSHFGTVSGTRNLGAMIPWHLCICGYVYIYIIISYIIYYILYIIYYILYIIYYIKLNQIWQYNTLYVYLNV